MTLGRLLAFLLALAALAAPAPARAQQLASLGAEAAAERPGEQRIPAARIRSYVAEYVLARAEGGGANTEVEIAWDRDVILPEGAVSVNVRPAEATELSGYLRMNVEFAVDGEAVWTEKVPARVKTYREALVVASPIRRGGAIEASSVRVRRVESSALQGATFSSPDEVAGRRARQTLDAGAVLYANAVDLPPLVKRGAMVNLVVETTALSISTVGEVKEQGGAGDTVRVLNVATGKIVFGCVVDAQTVKARF